MMALFYGYDLYKMKCFAFTEQKMSGFKSVFYAMFFFPVANVKKFYITYIDFVFFS